MRLFSGMKAAHQPSGVAHTLVFLSETGNEWLLLPSKLNRLLGLCFTAGPGRSWETFLAHPSHVLLYYSLWHGGESAPFRNCITGHLLRHIARFNNWWAGEDPASLSPDLMEHWNMANNNAHMTPWRWLVQFSIFSLSLPLFLTFPYPFFLFRMFVHLFTRLLEYNFSFRIYSYFQVQN